MTPLIEISESIVLVLSLYYCLRSLISVGVWAFDLFWKEKKKKKATVAVINLFHWILIILKCLFGFFLFCFIVWCTTLGKFKGTNNHIRLNTCIWKHSHRLSVYLYYWFSISSNWKVLSTYFFKQPNLLVIKSLHKNNMTDNTGTMYNKVSYICRIPKWKYIHRTS